ncbi:hypothetical protein SprV_0200574300 [Sparganum proliferum]
MFQSNVLVWILLFISLLKGYVTQPFQKCAILFTDPTLDQSRSKKIFTAALNNYPNSQNVFSQCEVYPTFLNNLQVPASESDLKAQYSILQNSDIRNVSVGPPVFYGPTFFSTSWSHSSVGFDLSPSILSGVVKTALQSLAQDISLPRISLLMDSDPVNLANPFEEIQPFSFLSEITGRFVVHYTAQYATANATISALLLDLPDIIIFHVKEISQLQNLLNVAQRMNVLMPPIRWLILNGGLTLSQFTLNKPLTNILIVELATNGRADACPELRAVSQPYTPSDLIFCDMAKWGLYKLDGVLNQTSQTAPPTTFTTSTEITPVGNTLSQKWVFWVFTQASFNATSDNYIIIDTNGQVSKSLPDLKLSPSLEQLLDAARQSTFRIGIRQTPPFILYEGETPKNPLTSGTITGPVIKIITTIFQNLNLSMEFVENNDLPVGEKTPTGWTGLFGRLQRRELDMIAGPFAAIEPMTTDFQPTSAFYSEQFNFFYKKPTLSTALQIFQFVVAFDVWVWVLTGVAAVVVAGALTLAHFLSPNRRDYGIYPSLMFTFGYLLQGIRTRAPNRLSSQIIVVVWWFFCLTFIVCFVANYAAYISFTALSTLPNDPTSLLQQKEYSYGFVKGSVTENFLSTSTQKDLQAIYNTIVDQSLQNIVPNRTVGIQKVAEGGFALIDESPYVDYYADFYCLEKGQPFWQYSLVFFLPNNYPFFELIESEMKRIISEGYISGMFSDPQLGFTQSSSTNVSCGVNLQEEILSALQVKLIDWSPYSITLDTTIGVFILCIVGLLIVGITAIVEYYLGVFKKNDGTS